jgi:adenylate cyclase
MADGHSGAPPADGPDARRDSFAPMRYRHYSESAERNLRVLKVASGISAVIGAGFVLMLLFSRHSPWWLITINVATPLVFLTVPLLRIFGDLVAPLTFMTVAYFAVFVTTWHLGTAAGLQTYLIVAAALSVLVLGVEHLVLAGIVAVGGAVLALVLELCVPRDTGVEAAWLLHANFAISVLTSALLAFATIAFALRAITRAEAAMEMEYERSEALLANILPASIAARLKDPARESMIADRYDDASVLFADIAGFTERSSDIDPCDLVEFLDKLYTHFDLLVDRNGLEKIKTSGDGYMVVSGVPNPRPDHLGAIASLALDMVEATSRIRYADGSPVPIRIGLAAGPLVAGVVGSRRFFYDVWGDAVNVASRMESSAAIGHIQAPQNVYETLRDDFRFKDRGDVVIKGKGVMHTWYLMARRTPTAPTAPDHHRQATVSGPSPGDPAGQGCAHTPRPSRAAPGRPR